MKIMSALLLIVNILGASMALAGGVQCKECPAETSACAPIPGCDDYPSPHQDHHHSHCSSEETTNGKGKNNVSAYCLDSDAADFGLNFPFQDR